MGISKNRKNKEFLFSDKPQFRKYSTLIDGNPTISNVFYIGDLIYPGLNKGKKAWLTRRLGKLLDLVGHTKNVDEGFEELFIETVKPFVKEALNSLGAVSRMNVEIALNELE